MVFQKKIDPFPNFVRFFRAFDEFLPSFAKIFTVKNKQTLKKQTLKTCRKFSETKACTP